MARLLALGSLLVGAAASPAEGDLFALVQRQVLAHRSLEQHGNGLQSFMQATRGGLSAGRIVAEKAALGKQANPAGVAITGRKRVVEGGSDLSFSLEPGCTTTAGTTDCEVAWGRRISFSSALHVPSGLKADDEIVIDVGLKFLAGNASESVVYDLLENVFAKHGKVKMTIRCSLCDGECKATSANEAQDYNLELIQPTTMEPADVCNDIRGDGTWTELQLLNFSMKLPSGPPAEWQLRGSVALDVSLARGGSEIVGESVAFDLHAGTAPAQLAQRRAAAPRPLPTAPEPAGQPQRTLSEMLWGMYGAAWGATIAQAAALQPAPTELMRARPGDETAAGLNAFVIKLKDVRVAGQSDYKKNLTFWSSESCKEDHGVVCTLPFNSNATFDFLVNFEANLEQGSYVKVSTGPKVSGFFGAIVNNLVPVQKFKFPACDGDIKISMAGQDFSMKAGKCGRYSAYMSIPVMKVTVPDVSKIDIKQLMPPSVHMPFPISDISKLPPVSMNSEVSVYDKDDNLMLAMKVEVGMEHH